MHAPAAARDVYVLTTGRDTHDLSEFRSESNETFEGKDRTAIIEA
jgi:hypothetical protein